MKSWLAPERGAKALGEAPREKVICWRIFFDRGEQELSILVTNIVMFFIIAEIISLKFDYDNDNCNVKDD